MDELDKIRELIFSGVDHNIELGIIMAHGLNISLEDTLGELLKSIPLRRGGINVFNIFILPRTCHSSVKSGLGRTSKTERRIILKNAFGSIEGTSSMEIDLAVKKLLIIFKNKIDGLQSE